MATTRKKKKSGNFISSAIKKPGQLHRDLGVPQGKPIPKGKIAAAAKGSGKTAQRARLAQTLGKMNSSKKKKRTSSTRKKTK